jgi:hypothetical protein
MANSGMRVLGWIALCLDKGHTEGLEPNATDKLIRLKLAAPGGTLRKQ